MKTFLKVFNLIIVTFLVVSCQKNDEDESRPYEFGFTIDGQQHRHEKKDANGIIEGQFGFITADGIYHVTVYATDENGDFKILSMRNVRISAPLDGSPLPPGAKIEGGQPGTGSSPNQIQPSQPQPQAPINNNALQILQQPTTTNRPRGPYAFTTQPTIKPACGGCGYVTTVKPKPGQSSFQFQNPAFQNPPNAGVNAPNSQSQGGNVNTGSNYPSQGDSQQNTPQGGNTNPNSGPSYPQGGAGVIPGSNYPQTGVNPGSTYPQTGDTPSSTYPESGGAPGSNYPQGGANQPAYPQTGVDQGSTYPQTGDTPSSTYPQSGGTPGSNYPQGGANQPTYPQTGGGEYNQSPNGANPPQGDFNPSPNYPNQITNYPGGASVAESPFKGTTVANGAIQVPGNADIQIKDKFPGMSDGLPNGVSEKDVTDLLYKFHYTVGFHGHYEMGLKNGAKVGGYFVNGRDGISRVVTYVADENGFRPKVKFVRLDLNSDDVPKEGTEKTFGLKSFEFVWYPIK